MSTILHSIYGRKLGLDASGYITVGEAKGLDAPAVKVGTSGSAVAIFGSTAVQAATSATTGTALNFGGYITLTSSSTSTWSLAAPFPGRSVTVTKIGTSTAAGSTATVTLASGLIQTSTISTATSVLIGAGGSVTLHGLTTGLATIMPFTTAASNATLT